MWPQHKVEVYEQMVAELRTTLERNAPSINPQLRIQLNGIINDAVNAVTNGAPIVAIGLPELETEEPGPSAHAAPSATGAIDDAETVEAPAQPAIDPFRHGAKAEANRMLKAKDLARWLWDRDISGEQVMAFSNKWRNKMARAAGVNPPSTLETWTVVADLMERMAQLDDAGSASGISKRHHLDEHEQWVTER